MGYNIDADQTYPEDLKGLSRPDSKVVPFLETDDIDNPYRQVTVNVVGEDGQYLIAVGHVDGLIFTVCAVAKCVELYGLGTVEDMLEWSSPWVSPPPGGEFAYFVGEVRHRWAIYEYKEAHDDTWLTWEDITEDTPGSFPITVLDLED